MRDGTTAPGPPELRDEQADGAADILYLVDRLEELVGVGKIDQYALPQFTRVEDAVQQGLQIIMDAVRETTAEMESAKRHIGG